MKICESHKKNLKYVACMWLPQRSNENDVQLLSEKELEKLNEFIFAKNTVKDERKIDERQTELNTG